MKRPYINYSKLSILPPVCQVSKLSYAYNDPISVENKCLPPELRAENGTMIVKIFHKFQIFQVTVYFYTAKPKLLPRHTLTSQHMFRENSSELEHRHTSKLLTTSLFELTGKQICNY